MAKCTIPTCGHYTCRNNDTLCAEGKAMAQSMIDLPNGKSMRHNWRYRDEKPMGYRLPKIEKEPYQERKDINNATAHYCVDCGVKNWILHPDDVEFNKFRCDDCNTWNYIEPKLNRPVKIEPVNDGRIKKPSFFTDERKASIGQFFRSKWKRKSVTKEDAQMGSFLSIAMLYVSIAFFISGLFRLQTPEAELTENQWRVGEFMVMTSIFLVMYLISHVGASYYGLKHNVQFLKDQVKYSSIIILVSSTICAVGFGIYKLLEGVISLV